MSKNIIGLPPITASYHSIQSDMRREHFQLERAQSIFSRQQSGFSSAEKFFSQKSSENTTGEKSYQEMIEKLLSKKETELANAKELVNTKQAQLKLNQEKFGLNEDDSDATDKTSLEEEMEQLILETRKLMENRLNKDFKFTNFSEFQNSFAKVFKNRNEIDHWALSEIAGKKEDLSRIRQEYEEKFA